MSIFTDETSNRHIEDKEYFSRSGSDRACINCQCGYKDAFETDDTTRQRSLKQRIHKDTPYGELQQICDDLGIVIDCDGIQAPSLSGNLEHICIQVRRKMIQRIQDNRIFFQAIHADDLADIG